MTLDQWGGIIFGLGSVVLFGLAAAQTISYLISHDTLHAALAVLIAGFGVALAYESVACWFGMSTISSLAAHAFVSNPVIWLAVLAAVMFVGGNLVVDFRVLERVRGWLVAAAIAALGIGAVIAIQTDWLP